MRRDRKAKIIATLGPASSEPAAIRRLTRAGGFTLISMGAFTAFARRAT